MQTATFDNDLLYSLTRYSISVHQMSMEFAQFFSLHIIRNSLDKLRLKVGERFFCRVYDTSFGQIQMQHLMYSLPRIMHTYNA